MGDVGGPWAVIAAVFGWALTGLGAEPFRKSEPVRRSLTGRWVEGREEDQRDRAHEAGNEGCPEEEADGVPGPVGGGGEKELRHLERIVTGLDTSLTHLAALP